MKKVCFLAILLTLTTAAFSQENTILHRDSLVLSLSGVDSVSMLIPVVYSNKGCGRCVTASDFLKANEMDFLKLDLGITKNRETMYHAAMRAEGKTSVSVMFPVIIYKRDVYYGQSPLREYLEALKQKFRGQAVREKTTQ